MAAIVNTNLAGFTVEYNGIQLGGADATYKSFPPTYSFRCEEHWDESRRAVMWLDCTLITRCTFYEATELDMSANMATIRRALIQPGKALRIQGLGSGFNYVQNPQGVLTKEYLDISNGPHPLPIEMNSLGQLCWELGWGVQFSISTCYSAAQETFEPIAFTSFNFTTTWRNDFEGYTARIIQGSVTIPMMRVNATSKVVLHVAEETRGNVVVYTPPGFKRVENTWNESEDHQRLNFTIVDEQLQGDPYPPGITAADGNTSFIAGSEKDPPMNQGVFSMNMSLKTAYNVNRAYAGQVFLAVIMSKQTEINAGLLAQPANANGEHGIAIPLHLSISNGKWDSCRLSQCSVAWRITAPLSAMLAATKIWEPVSTYIRDGMGGSQDYGQWRASMAALWNNRGTSGINELAADAVVIDLCDNLSSITIGNVGSNPLVIAAAALPSLSCPDVPANGGWLHFDMDVVPYREEQLSWHRRVASYLPAIGQSIYTYVTQPSSGNGTSVSIGGPDASQSQSDQHAAEYHGYPEFKIAIRFSGLRFKHVAYMPEIINVGGMNTRLISSQGGDPKQVMDSFGCPVWAVSGYRVYSVPGFVGQIKPISSLTATDTSVPLEL